RYLETLSPYARQYMPQLPRPAADGVSGLPPSVALEQRTARAGANSTVATVTEVAHYLRILWARSGTLHCPQCKIPIAARSPAALAAHIGEHFGKKTMIKLLAPAVRGRKGHYRELFERAQKEGTKEARVDGKFVVLKPGMKLARYQEHDVDLVISD